MLIPDLITKIQGGEGELHATIHVTRKETGKVETYNIVGRVAKDEPKVHGSSGGLAGGGASVNTQ